MEKRIIISMFLILILNLFLVSSYEFGYNYLTSSTPSSNPNITVNDSLYWSGFLPSTYNTTYIYPTISNLWTYISNNEPSWLSTYNSTYQTWAYNQTVLYSNGTGLDLDNYIFSLKPTIFYNVSAISLVRGTAVGTIDDTKVYDSISYNVTEQAGSPGLDVRFNFTGVTDFNQIIFRYKSSVGENHISYLQIYDYDDADWESYGTASEVSDYTVFEFGVFDADEHISGGLVQARVYTQDNGNTNHKHYFDWVQLSQGLSTPAGTEVDPLSFHKNENINNTGYNITASYFFGDGSELTNIPTFNQTYQDYVYGSIFQTTGVPDAYKSIKTNGVGLLDSSFYNTYNSTYDAKNTSKWLVSSNDIYYGIGFGAVGIGRIPDGETGALEVNNLGNYVSGIDVDTDAMGSGYAYGVNSYSSDTGGYGDNIYGVYGKGYSNPNGNVEIIGVKGDAVLNGDNGYTLRNYGLLGNASGVVSSGGAITNYGVYGSSQGSGATNWAGYFNDGNVYVKNNLTHAGETLSIGSGGSTLPRITFNNGTSSANLFYRSPSLRIESSANFYSAGYLFSSSDVYLGASSRIIFGSATSTNRYIKGIGSTTSNVSWHIGSATAFFNLVNTTSGEGRLGIGTTNPTRTLSVAGNIDSQGIYIPAYNQRLYIGASDELNLYTLNPGTVYIENTGAGDDLIIKTNSGNVQLQDNLNVTAHIEGGDYIRLPKVSGLTNTNTSGDVRVTIGTTMPDSTYSVQLTPETTRQDLVGSGLSAPICQVITGSKSTTQFTIHCNYVDQSSYWIYAYDGDVNWLVVDY